MLYNISVMRIFKYMHLPFLQLSKMKTIVNYKLLRSIL